MALEQLAAVQRNAGARTTIISSDVEQVEHETLLEETISADSAKVDEVDLLGPRVTAGSARRHAVVTVALGGRVAATERSLGRG